MKTTISAVALSIVLAGISPLPAGAQDATSASAATAQLAASAGLTPEEASGLTLSQLNALKYARDGNDPAAPPQVYNAAWDATDRPTPDVTQLALSSGIPPSAAGSLSLDEIATLRMLKSANYNK